MADVLSLPASTVYRTVRELVQAQFLAKQTEAKYRLGTVFIRYDRVLRMTDPITMLGLGTLQNLVAEAHVPCVGLVASLHGDHVMCVADEVLGEPPFRSSYERGKPMPLTRGATSKAILAQLPRRRLARLLGNPEAGTKDADLLASLGEIRKQGYVVSRGEIDTGLVGIAAPVSAPDADTVASLSLVVSEDQLDEAVERRLILQVVTSANMLRNALAVS